MFSLIFLVAALVLFILGIIPVTGRFNLVSAGLACLVAYLLWERVL